jgi:hypothetical protein
MPHVYGSGLGVVAEGESFELCVAYEAGPSPVKSVANGGRCCPHLKLPIQFRVLEQLLMLRASKRSIGTLKPNFLNFPTFALPGNRDSRFWFTA